ncbi:BPI fold-containing family B, member 9B [Apodemus speciosus]|uniref:BPI fold-containing family B, member 9B n=1 Tax=Apodemus speciosus TaxID=105296 RepID=A0ABQ0EJT9_APOSI
MGFRHKSVGSQALAIMLSIQAGTLDLVETPPVVGDLPAVVPGPLNLPSVLPSLPVLKGPPNHQRSPPKRPVPPSRGGKCVPAIGSTLSSDKLQDYLMKTLPPQIEDLVKCDDVDLDGVVGNLLTTVEGSAVMDILDVTSLLSGGGGLGIGGLLGKEGNEDSSKPSSGSKAAGGLGQLIPDGLPGTDVLGGLLNLGGDKGPGKGLLNGNGLSDIKKPVDDIVNNVSNLKDTVHDKVISMVPETVKEPLEGLLKMDIKETMLKLKVSQVTVDNLDKEKAKLDVTMNIAVSSNNTQCVNLDVQDTHMHVKEMNIQLIETSEKLLPLPVPLPLKDVVPVLLTAKINENLEKSNSCAIVLSDFNNCKNTSGLFSYQVQTVKISPRGLAILYCDNGLWEPSIGTSTMTQLRISTLRELHKPSKRPCSSNRTTQPGSHDSVQMNDLEAQITYIAFASQENNTLRVLYKVDIKKDGEEFATGESKLFISHGSKISNSTLIPDIKLTS